MDTEAGTDQFCSHTRLKPWAVASPFPHTPWNEREGALHVCVEGDVKERKVSWRTFNMPFLQGESWLSPGLRIALSPRDVFQDRENAISLEVELQQGSCDVQAVPQPDAAQRLDTAQTICTS